MATYKMVNADQLDADMVSVADSIRAKGGTSEKLTWPEGYKAAVEAIQTGGAAPVEEKDVNFYDYDGTLLYSYTLAEAQALTELPPGPTREGLVCQGWNWTLEQIKAMDRRTDVGAVYTTDDGASRFYITIESAYALTIPVHFYQNVANGVEIDWGDGSPVDTVSATGFIKAEHSYSAFGSYVIRLMPKSSVNFSLGANSSTVCTVGSVTNDNVVVRDTLRKVEIGTTNGWLYNGAFMYCHRLESVTMPANTIRCGQNVFSYDYRLRTIIIPQNITSFNGAGLVFACYYLETVSLPGKFTELYSGEFRECYGLRSVSLPNGMTTVNANSFYLTKLTYFEFPSSLTSIGSGAFYSCGTVKIFDFSRCTQVPSLGNANAFYGISSGCEIRVPSLLVDEWKSATNWTAYADNIVAV